MKLKIKKQTALLTLLSIISGIHSYAQTENKEATIDLDTYTVCASRMELSMGKEGSSMTVLNTENILAFETELATDAIRHIPGIYVRNNGGLGNSSGI